MMKLATVPIVPRGSAHGHAARLWAPWSSPGTKKVNQEPSVRDRGFGDGEDGEDGKIRSPADSDSRRRAPRNGKAEGTRAMRRQRRHLHDHGLRLARYVIVLPGCTRMSTTEGT